MSAWHVVEAWGRYGQSAQDVAGSMEGDVPRLLARPRVIEFARLDGDTVELRFTWGGMARITFESVASAEGMMKALLPAMQRGGR